VLNRIHVAQLPFPQLLVEVVLYLLVGLALELSCLALGLASQLVGLALCLAGNLVCLTLGLSSGLGNGLLYGLGGLLCECLSVAVVFGCWYADHMI
jgi:hypothetical protein